MQEKIGGLIVRFFNQFDMRGVFHHFKTDSKNVATSKHVPVCLELFVK